MVLPATYTQNGILDRGNSKFRFSHNGIIYLIKHSGCKRRANCFWRQKNNGKEIVTEKEKIYHKFWSERVKSKGHSFIQIQGSAFLTLASSQSKQCLNYSEASFSQSKRHTVANPCEFTFTSKQISKTRPFVFQHYLLGI